MGWLGPTLAAACLLLPAAAADPDTHEPRVVVEEYVAGIGDLFCGPSGVGCVKFLVQGGESTLHLKVDDEVHDPVGFDVCSPDCDGVTGRFCAQGTVTGLAPGDFVFVFLSELSGPLHCPFSQVGAAVKGTVTATFT